MSEYIFNVPDSNQPIAGDSAVYYPDERDDPMMVREEIVRCIDCEYADETESGSLRCNGYLVADWDYYNDMPSDGVKVKPDGFCAWGEKASNFTTCKCGEDIELGERESAVCPRCNRTVRA